MRQPSYVVLHPPWPRPEKAWGQIAGDIAADYLIQHVSRDRRYARVPASTWEALIGQVQDPGDIARLAASAKGRLLHRYALPLYRRLAVGRHEIVLGVQHQRAVRPEPVQADRRTTAEPRARNSRQHAGR